MVSKMLKYLLGCLTCLVELGVKGVEIEEQVDTARGKGSHAGIVITTRVYMIYPYSIGPQICHGGSVECTLSCISQRVKGGKLIGNACARC